MSETLKQLWTTLVVAAVAPVMIGILDPVGGRILDWRNVLFVTGSPVIVVAVVYFWMWAVRRPVRCHRCDNPCRFSSYHSECGRKRWVCTTCNALRTQSGGPG